MNDYITAGAFKSNEFSPVYVDTDTAEVFYEEDGEYPIFSGLFISDPLAVQDPETYASYCIEHDYDGVVASKSGMYYLKDGEFTFIKHGSSEPEKRGTYDTNQVREMDDED